MNDLIMHLRTLTPLWTGGVETGLMDRIHETGIIGSFRWWYEVLLRGLGGQVCNPTSDQVGDRCPVGKHYCDVCKLFGATGLSRAFRLSISGGESLFPPQDDAGKIQRINIKMRGGGHGWYFGAPRVSSTKHPIELRFIPIRDFDYEGEIRILASLISKWGGLGARPQLGWGVSDIQITKPSTYNLLGDLNNFITRFSGTPIDAGDFPSLDNMFFAKIYLNIRDNNYWNTKNFGIGSDDKRWKSGSDNSVPVSPAIKYKVRYGKPGLRPWFIELNNNDKVNYFLGDAKEKISCKINISNAYFQDNQWQIRIWGWVPGNNPVCIDREKLLREIHGWITSDTPFWDGLFGSGVVNLSKTIWREVDMIGHNRNQPTCKLFPSNPADFLRCLLSQEV